MEQRGRQNQSLLVTSARRLTLVALVVCLAPAWLAGQTNTGQISGVVRDAQGGVLPGAAVTALHVESGARLERITDDGGRYLLPSLRIGTYLLTVELAGFRRLARERLVVQLGQALELDLVLDVGGPTEEVRVSGETPLLQAANAEISDVIDNSRVVEIPLNGRSFLSLAQLSDAVVLPPGGTRGDALQQAGPLPNVGGQRSGHNIYLLDGVKVTDELFNNLVINPSVDSIQEFKIQKSQYPAEFGGKASALINVATRAGGNRFRGGAFEFFRDDRFDARNYFDAADRPKPPLRQNQFGGTAGGPIVADRAFFFASYEGQRINRSLTRTFTVPSAAMRGGDFGGAPRSAIPRSARDRSVRALPGNRIPSAQLDPVAVGLLQQVPLPTSDAAIQNLTSVAAQVKDVDQISVRVDQRMSGRRPAVRTLQHVRCRRGAAVWHERAAGDVAARIRPHPRHQDEEYRRQLHAHLQPLGRARNARRLDADLWRAAQRESRRRLRRRQSACRASRAIRATSGIRRCRPAASTARSATRRRSSFATTSISRSTTT